MECRRAAVHTQCPAVSAYILFQCMLKLTHRGSHAQIAYVLYHMGHSLGFFLSYNGLG